MPATCRLSDSCTGHGCFPSRINITASGDVFTNSRGNHRVGDSWAQHCCVACHGGTLAAGSPNVFTNSQAQGRVTDPIDCGSMVMSGSPNVITN